jgi:hypothetical protein
VDVHLIYWQSQRVCDALLFSSVSMVTKKGLTQEGEGRYLTKNKHHHQHHAQTMNKHHHLHEHAKNEQTPSSRMGYTNQIIIFKNMQTNKHHM